MPPHLHPRSTATSTLFAGTLLASFIVVGIPHVFPCPRPRTGYAADAGKIQFDEGGKPVRRQPTSKADNTSETSAAVSSEDEKVLQHQTKSPPSRKSLAQSRNLDEETAMFRELQAEAEILETQAKLARECPVPKPTGWVGRILGFEEQKGKALEKAGREKG